MMLALNGIPIVAIELKNQLTGQSIDDAKRQWMYNRDPKEPCFGQNKRILAYFAVDLYDAAVATVIDRDKTPFLPFNQGSNGAGRDGGAGNPPTDDGDYVTSYLWKEVWQKDKLLDIVQKFINVQKEEKKTKNSDGSQRIETKTKVIFPRYHQLDVVRKLVAHVRENGAGHNYLIQHSAGSGKSNSIAWTAYRMASLHNEDNEAIFDSVIIVTDRRVLDQQLQATELVRHTIEFIKRKPYGNNLLIKVKDEVKLIVDATPSYERYDCQKIIEANKKKAVRHAYFREYLALQRLCLLILQHQKHQIGAGSKQIYGILFDGAWLWEEYIGSLVDNVFYHPMNKAGKGAQRLFGGNIGLIYPDFISRDHETRVIADAKYKPLDNIGNKDYLQVLAYMLRFDAKKGYYLYPEAEGADDLQLWLNKGSTYEANVVPRDDICIIKHGLKIPIDAENYESFVSKMQVSESEFRQVFIG